VTPEEPETLLVGAANVGWGNNLTTNPTP